MLDHEKQAIRILDNILRNYPEGIEENRIPCDDLTMFRLTSKDFLKMTGATQNGVPILNITEKGIKEAARKTLDN